MHDIPSWNRGKEELWDNVEEKTVLVIEDNELNMKLAERMLVIGGYGVLKASTAESGLELARSRRPHLILLDIQLPGMDGHMAAALIKGDPLLSGTPLIALTAHAMAGDAEKALEAGFDGYLTKPIEMTQLLGAVDTVLAPSAKRENAPSSRPEETILVVDDEPMNVKLLSLKLMASGYRVLKQYDGQSALETAKRHLPDLILLDIMMPGMDGYEVLRKLKEDPETSRIPVVLITALDGKGEKEKGLSAGADEFLNKPVNMMELEARTASLLAMKRYRERLGAVRAGGDEQEGEEAVLLLPTVMAVEDVRCDALLIQEYLRGISVGFRHAASAEDAWEILVREKIDLVFLDLLLPGMDGIDLCRKIKDTEGMEAVQVVIVTRLDDLKIKIRGIDVGADDFLVKPVNREEIRARTRALLKKKRYLDRLREQNNGAFLPSQAGSAEQ